MRKRGDLLIVVLILALLIAGNIYIYFSKTKITLSTLAVKDISNRLVKFDFSTITFVLQWIIILAIALIFYIKFIKKKKDDTKEVVEIKVKRESGGSKAHTDLDDLYNLLKDKKSLKIPVIAKTFNIDKERALEWCKILEEHNLVSVEYPAFSEPEVIIKQ